MAEFVVIADVLNNAIGNMAKDYTITGLDTSAFATPGERGYLSETVGGFSVTAVNRGVTGTDNKARQVVGKVLVVNASTGVFHFAIEEENLLDTPIVKDLVKDTEGDTAVDTIRVTCQVEDKYGVAIQGRHELHIWVNSVGLFGAADAGVQTTNEFTGELLRETVDKEMDVLTDATGGVLFDVTAAGTTTRYVGVVLGNAHAKAIQLDFLV